MGDHSKRAKFIFTEEEIKAPKFESKPGDYIIDDALHNAVKVSILLKQPLLLTGEPGTGKTRLAEKLAADLYESEPQEYLSRPLVFHTKTVSTYTDLFYTYDALSHFHDAHITKKPAHLRARMKAPAAAAYIRLQALGQAIILSKRETAVNASVYKHMKEVMEDPTFVSSIHTDHVIGPRSSVVLIDEVDKAPRDFTNDLLNELDRYEFNVREDGNRPFKRGEKNIFLVLTSNSENNLPDAFLRRCIFYHIQFPTEDILYSIVLKQLFGDGREINDDVHKNIRKYIHWFYKVGQKHILDKKPATAELISWLQFLKPEIEENIGFEQLPDTIRNASFCILAKEKKDLQRLSAPIIA